MPGMSRLMKFLTGDKEEQKKKKKKKKDEKQVGEKVVKEAQSAIQKRRAAEKALLEDY